MADFKAKRHSIFESLKKDLALGFLESEVHLHGFKFKLRTLNEESESWADTYTRSNTPMSMMTSVRAPKLAAAIQSINDIPLHDLFQYPDSMEKGQKAALDDNPVAKQFWLREQMLYFLLEESARQFINELWQEFDKLVSKRKEGQEELPKS